VQNKALIFSNYKNMKPTSTLLFLLFSLISFSQTKEKSKYHSKTTSNVVTFVTILDIANASKDGIYLNGYVVNISYEQAKKLNGKKIRITGKVTIRKGFKNRPNEDIRQERETDSKHIKSPKIEIIKM
jgi:hypothetical protein